MLQEILTSMYIEPEILEELDEEQKQILFCKMREEQVRRWKMAEDELEKKENKKPKKPRKPGKRNIGFLEGKDGDPWTWVMGEHNTDQSIEQILIGEEQDKASQMAEEEAEQLRLQQDAEMERNKKEEEERLAEEERKQQEELKRKIQEAESQKEAKMAAKKLEEEQKKEHLFRKQKSIDFQKKHELRRRSSTLEITNYKRRRSTEIYMTMMDARKKYEKMAEESSQKIEDEWIQQERKAKEADAEIRAIARVARQEHKRSLRQIKTESVVIGTLMMGLKDVRDRNANRPPVPQRKPTLPTGVHVHVRPSKPTSRASIIQWFTEVERPKGTGLDPKTEQVAQWFHGIISRPEAEELLTKCKVGTFLVRVSEKIWGYAISYRSQERCKHFLIDTSEGNYQFFGTNQVPHSKLAELITFHKSQPISHSGKELLLHACGQSGVGQPDYAELFSDLEAQTSYL